MHLCNCGIIPTETEIERIMREMDIDGNGSVDIMEFLILMSDRKKKELSDLLRKAIALRASIRKAFKEFDKNGDGFITKKEFKKVVQKRNGVRISAEQLDVMLKDADKNGDGKIDYDEFVLIMTEP